MPARNERVDKARAKLPGRAQEAPGKGPNQGQYSESLIFTLQALIGRHVEVQVCASLQSGRPCGSGSPLQTRICA